jgi:23S rRNA (uracil1939-C5)-methyltransferase
MLGYEEQVAHKQRTLEHLLAPFAPRHWDEPLVAEPWHYRHRARFGVGVDAHGRPQLGFKSANSHRIVETRHCDIVDRRLLPLLDSVPRWLAQLAKWKRIEEIALVVDSAGRLALSYRADTAFPPADRALLQQLAREAGVGLADAPLRYELPGQGVALDFCARDFTQVNPAINDALVARCIDWLDLHDGDRVADFFCGLGNFSLPMARRGAAVTGFEVSADMVARAARNAAAAGIDGAAFEVVDLFENVPSLPAGLAKAVLDPPRAGARLLCERLAKSRLQALVHVSCNPHTLVRDLRTLVDGGFAVERAALVDMFPQTGHIEAMVLCRR